MLRDIVFEREALICCGVTKPRFVTACQAANSDCQPFPTTSAHINVNCNNRQKVTNTNTKWYSLKCVFSESYVYLWLKLFTQMYFLFLGSSCYQCDHQWCSWLEDIEGWVSRYLYNISPHTPFNFDQRPNIIIILTRWSVITRPWRVQCVTFDNTQNLNNTETETFFRYQFFYIEFFRYQIRYFIILIFFFKTKYWY